MKKPVEIKTHPTLESLFPINPALLEKIEQDMRQGKYDSSQPIILATWEGQPEPVCIDGLTRLQAALNSEVEQVPVWLHDFDTEEQALEKAIKLQRNRRNMTDAELLTCIELLDRKKPRGGDRRSEAAKSNAQSCANESSAARSSGQTGELLGISSRKVEMARTVMEHADEDTKAAVKSGEKSINRAYQQTQEQRKQTARKKQPKETVSDTEQEEDYPEWTRGAPVFISMAQFGALHKLGGSVEEHLERAVDRYLFLMESAEQDDYLD